MLCRMFVLTMIVVLCPVFADAASGGLARGIRVIEPFGYTGVTIDDGSMRRQIDEVRDYYLRIPNDDLLKGFRARAGKPAPGVDLGAWYSSDTFHVFGQIVSGLARMYAATGDQACRDKVNTLISEWGKCIDPDGFFYFSRTPNAPHYIYEKMVCGLVDAYLYCGNKDAIRYLSTITDWAVKNLDRKNAGSPTPDPTEWYTLSENLYRAYLATGDAKYKTFARVWEYTPYWDIYAAKGDIFKPVGAYHAYSHVNTLNGAAAAYLVTGEKHYLDTIRNAHDYLLEHQCFATGGYGPDEHLIPESKLPAKLTDSVNTFETQCGSWGAFKLCKYLISFTGDARYGDWIERLAINGIGASIPSSPDGSVFYYSNYNTGGASKQNIYPWACCAGTRPQAIADYCDLAYFRDAGGIYVNLFTPSTVKWNHRGTAIALQQKTRFPEDSRLELTIQVSKPTKFAVKLRAPGWLAGKITAKVNGKPVDVTANSLHWAVLRRTWKDGDRVAVDLPMDLRAERFPASSQKPYPAALMKGPVVLALRANGSPQNPASLVDFGNLGKSLMQSPGEPLTYHLAADPSVLVRPFYAYKQGERYVMYLNPEMVFTNTGHNQLDYSPGWQNVGVLHITTQPGAEVRYTFEGEWVRWVGFEFDDAGRAEVSIDGKVVDVVDQYAPGREVPFRWERTGLSAGNHTIAIKLLEEKNALSKDRYINIARLETP